MILFLIWAFGFWPAMALASYAVMEVFQPASVNVVGVLLILFVVWGIGLIHTFGLYRVQQNALNPSPPPDDDEHDYELYVEAPDEAQAMEAGTTCLLADAPFKSPRVGLRIVLNDDASPAILGTVEEAIRETVDDYNGRMWVKLDRAEDFAELAKRSGWTAASEGRRSTSPAISLGDAVGH